MKEVRDRFKWIGNLVSDGARQFAQGSQLLTLDERALDTLLIGNVVPLDHHPTCIPGFIEVEDMADTQYPVLASDDREYSKFCVCALFSGPFVCHFLTS